MSRSPSSRRHFVRILARHSTAPTRGILRPLVLGVSILRRPAASRGRWHVDIVCDAGLMPHMPGSPADVQHIKALHEACGQTCRLALTLAVPRDAPARATASRNDNDQTSPPDIYGWALLYQLPGYRGTAFIDPHDAHPDLPAFYECPLEFLDRAGFLAGKGIPYRPRAVVTCARDFTTSDGWHPRRNRYFPDSRFHRPVDIAKLA